MTVIDLLRPSLRDPGGSLDDAPAVAAARRETRAPAAWGTGSRAWLPIVLGVATIASITTTVIVHVTGHAGLWGDEPSHLLHARRFFDSADPGFGQLGNYWPPLLHWLELPFAWNAWLVYTGLAGQIPSMLMFLAAVAGAFALGVELSGQRRVGALTSLAYVANPNLLFLQSSAMMETGVVMTLTWATVWLLRFRRTGRFRDAVVAGAWGGVAVFATWAALVLPVYGAAVVLAACRRHGFEWAKARAYTAAYALPVAYAVLIWLGWNWYIQNDALYMLHYRHPATVVHTVTAAHANPLRPDVPHGLLSLGSAVLDNVAPAAFALAAIVLVVGVLRGRLLHPLGVALLGGVLVLAEWVEGQGGLIGSPTFAWLLHLHGRDVTGLNVRYALWLLPFVAGAIAVAAGRARWRQLLVVVALVASSLWFLPAARGIVTVHSADMVTAHDEAVASAAAHRLRADYRGGRILTSASGGGDRMIWLSGLPARSFLTQFDGKDYAAALARPDTVARYVLMSASLRRSLPEERLIAAGFHPVWTAIVAGDAQTLWVLDSESQVAK